MRIKLFNCHPAVLTHRLTQGLFATLVSGLHDAPDGSYLGDLGGDNIAHDNAYTELRHQYVVWKNLLRHYDYVGFEHYRRMFVIDPMPYDTLADLSWELADRADADPHRHAAPHRRPAGGMLPARHRPIRRRDADPA